MSRQYAQVAFDRKQGLDDLWIDVLKFDAGPHADFSYM
jgi:hypothetical protein